MTVFSAYVLSSLSLSLLTWLQAEIPGQDQDGYDTEPNFFHGMHQVRTMANPSFLPDIVYYSVLKFRGHDLNSTLGVLRDSGSLWLELLVQLLHRHLYQHQLPRLHHLPPHHQPLLLPPSKPIYDTYTPGHLIMQHHRLSKFLSQRLKRCARSILITVSWVSDV